MCVGGGARGAPAGPSRGVPAPPDAFRRFFRRPLCFRAPWLQRGADSSPCGGDVRFGDACAQHKGGQDVFVDVRRADALLQ